MSTLGAPVPPRPAAFTPDGVPPGVRWNPLPIDRPRMDQAARLIIYHTNGAPNRSSLPSQRRMAIDGTIDTKPTYAVGLDENDGAEKWLRSDQLHVANGTVTEGTTVNGRRVWPTLTDEQRASITAHGRAAQFSLAIESIDLGTNNGLGGASDYQGEMVARIFAYESLVPPGFPLEEPPTWHGAGVSCHTLPPGDFPFWTIHRGKTCPGDQKKADFRAWILPRAREIRAAWTAPPEPTPTPDEENDMKILLIASSDGTREQKQATFWFDGRTIGGIQFAKVMRLAIEHGVYTADADGAPFRVATVAEINRLIERNWAGGPVPSGFSAPAKASVDSGVG